MCGESRTHGLTAGGDTERFFPMLIILARFRKTNSGINDSQEIKDKGFARVKALAELAREVKLTDLHGCDLESILFFLIGVKNWVSIDD